MGPPCLKLWWAYDLVYGHCIVLSIWCHIIPCFHFCYLFRNNYKRDQVDKTDFRRCCGNFFRMFYSKSTWSLYSKFFRNNYDAPWQQHLKDTLWLKLLRTWIASTKAFYLLLHASLSLKEAYILNLI